MPENQQHIQQLLEQVRSGALSIEAASAKLAGVSVVGDADLDFARIDTARARRRGFPETIFCPGKTNEQIVKIIAKFRENESLVLASRATADQARAITDEYPEAKHYDIARLVLVGEMRQPPADAPTLLVISAGTSDINIAEEAAVTAEVFGQRVERLYDVGVAGLHRLLGELERVRAADVIIVVAGMDGALPSVVGGLVAVPVIAVPTSTGYGAAFQGLSALLTMLNSCSPGVAVVNIDNGFGAAYMAATILESARERKI